MAKLITFTTISKSGENAGHAVTFARPMTILDLKNIRKKNLKCGEGGFHVCANCATTIT